MSDTGRDPRRLRRLRRVLRSVVLGLAATLLVLGMVGAVLRAMQHEWLLVASAAGSGLLWLGLLLVLDRFIVRRLADADDSSSEMG